MAKIPFDIKYRPQIESGEYKVETRDGKPVRIICWDKKIIQTYENLIPLLFIYFCQNADVNMLCVVILTGCILMVLKEIATFSSSPPSHK